MCSVYRLITQYYVVTVYRSGVGASGRSWLEWRLDHRGGGPRLASLGRVCRPAAVGHLRFEMRLAAAIRIKNDRLAVCSEAGKTPGFLPLTPDKPIDECCDASG